MEKALDSAVEQAFTNGSILRTQVLRPTWHFVTPADIRWLLSLTAPRVQAVNATMLRKLELDSAVLKRSAELVARALQGGNQLMRDELGNVLRKVGIPSPEGQRMTYIMMHAELEAVVCSGARHGKQFTYALLDERAPQARNLNREDALAELAGRFFTSRGPATAHDFSRWSGLTVADARAGIEAIQPGLHQERLDGRTIWFAPSGRPATAGTPAAYLLSIYDEYVSGYKDRGDICSPEIGAKLVAMGNDLQYIVVVDGQIVGTWKRTLRKDAVIIEMNLFTELSPTGEDAVRRAAQRYGDFLQLPVELNLSARIFS
jgi:hypothetical protein